MVGWRGTRKKETRFKLDPFQEGTSDQLSSIITFLPIKLRRYPATWRKNRVGTQIVNPRILEWFAERCNLAIHPIMRFFPAVTVPFNLEIPTVCRRDGEKFFKPSK